MKAKSEQLKRRNGEEAFLESVLSADGLSKRTLLDMLSELSIDLPRPKKLKDRELTAKLWQVIHALLGQSIVLCNTDHLSDRELYTLLWGEVLHKPFVISPHYTLYVDMTKTGVDGGMPIYLKYYATEAQRKMYSEFYPAFKMPRHIAPPCRRDHLIPDVPPQASRQVN